MFSPPYFQQGARRSLAQARNEYDRECERLNEMNHVAAMFEFPELMKNSNDIIASCERDLRSVSLLWDLVEECQLFFSSTMDALWKDVDSEAMEEETKALMKRVKALPREVKTSDSYQGLDKEVKNFMSTCPLINELHSKAMRPRHWELLKHATGMYLLE